jgi:hypothetical protein
VKFEKKSFFARECQGRTPLQQVHRMKKRLVKKSERDVKVCVRAKQEQFYNPCFEKQ